MSPVTGSEAERRGAPAVLRRLREMILEGEYGPEERLIEEQLAELLGVSRTPVRQALTMLEAEGLIEIVPNRGAMVCSFGVDDVWDIYDLRAELEGYGARRAASRVTEEGLVVLRGFVEEQEGIEAGLDQGDEVRRLVSVNQRFHGEIVAVSGNRRLERLIRRTVQVPLMFKAFYWYTERERVISNHYHRQILTALEQRDGLRAEIVMRKHVYEGRDFVIEALKRDRGDRGERDE
ncbi:MAG: GntR family transcriptional regulator [Rubrobacteraceae bacterium]